MLDDSGLDTRLRMPNVTVEQKGWRHGPDMDRQVWLRVPQSPDDSVGAGSVTVPVPAYVEQDHACCWADAD